MYHKGDPMQFGQSISTCFSKYATFSGRASRSEFWWFLLFCWAFQIILIFFDWTLTSAGIFSVATILPYFAVAARRLHDINKSGWLQLISIIPLVGFIILIVWWASDGEKRDNQYGKKININKQ